MRNAKKYEKKDSEIGSNPPRTKQEKTKRRKRRKRRTRKMMPLTQTSPPRDVDRTPMMRIRLSLISTSEVEVHEARNAISMVMRKL